MQGRVNFKFPNMGDPEQVLWTRQLISNIYNVRDIKHGAIKLSHCKSK